jgi:hypothetical protein
MIDREKVIRYLEDAGLKSVGVTEHKPTGGLRISTILADDAMHVELIPGVVSQRKLDALIAKCKEPSVSPE